VAEVIRIDALGFAYDDKVVLKDLSLSARAGEALVLLGPSGIGKSTILRLMSGLLEPTSGTVTVSPTQSGVGTRMAFQEPRLFPWMSVRKNLYFALRAAEVPREEWDGRIEPLMAQVGLSEEMDASISSLSIGMAQRVALVRALVCKPSVLLLDEPFSALDPKRRLQLQQDLLKLVSFTQVSVVLVTHDVQEAIAVGDQIVVLSGSPASVALRVDLATTEKASAQQQIEDLLLG